MYNREAVSGAISRRVSGKILREIISTQFLIYIMSWLYLLQYIFKRRYIIHYNFLAVSYN
jgi:hypothetical protein